MFQNKSRKHTDGCGSLKPHIHRLFSVIAVNSLLRDPYLMICLITTRVPFFIFRSVDHTIKNRQQSICQRFPGLITSYSSRKVGGTLVRQAPSTTGFVNCPLFSACYIAYIVLEIVVKCSCFIKDYAFL